MDLVLREGCERRVLSSPFFDALLDEKAKANILDVFSASGRRGPGALGIFLNMLLSVIFLEGVVGRPSAVLLFAVSFSLSCCWGSSRGAGGTITNVEVDVDLDEESDEGSKSVGVAGGVERLGEDEHLERPLRC